MAALTKRKWVLAAIFCIAFLLLWQPWFYKTKDYSLLPPTSEDDQFIWRHLPRNYAELPLKALPTASTTKLPAVQAKFRPELKKEKLQRLKRRDAVRVAFERSWQAYRKHAWLKDEVTPISGQSKDTFGGWGATLIDSLDTLWIMGMESEYQDAVQAVSDHISFETSESQEINVFETTIRFLGGLLSAYELSGETKLLIKARDVGDMLYKAFDTPNNLPLTRWNLHEAALNKKQTAHTNALLAEMGSLVMEFTKLSLLTRDAKYYTVVQHISELLVASQMKTKLPGMWPIVVDAAHGNLDAGSGYSLGAMADSAYEYLSKMVALLGSGSSSSTGDGIYRQMHERSMHAAQTHLFYRPMVPHNDNVLFSGFLSVDGNEKKLETSAGHLTCFAGGMLALGGKLTSNDSQVDIGAKLTRGCIWAYAAMGSGVMPETFHLTSCPSDSGCDWNNSSWYQAVQAQNGGRDAATVIDESRLPKGFTKVPDARYILRPEAIESVFIMYRVTGDSYWTDKAWIMWESIEKLTHTELANSAVWNVNPEPGAKVEDNKSDSMESFWLGETLKYFYLIFSEPELISLDDWVFNTEAHPLRRLKA